VSIRVSTAAQYTRFVRDIHLNLRKLVTGQEQAGSGKRILRPSDDPAGAARAISLRARLSANTRLSESIQASLPYLQMGTSSLEDASGVLSKANALVIQGLSGTLSPEDRGFVAAEIDALRAQLLDIANTKLGDRYLFAGTTSGAKPFEEVVVDGVKKVVYTGDDAQLKLQLGAGSTIATNAPGSALFAAQDPAGAALAGLTGAALGSTANEGSGYETLYAVHTATDPGALGTVGVALVDGGAGDTLLGDQSLVIDTAAGTVQLGNGTAVPIPDPLDPVAQDVVVSGELGGELHLDFSGWSGAALTTTVHGDGEISLDGKTFVPVTFTETDLQLTNPATGAVLHVDTTQLVAAGEDLVTFRGTVNVFDALQGIADALRADDLSQSELHDTIALLSDELGRNRDELLGGLSVLGARTERLLSTDQRLLDTNVQVQGLLSDVEDADYAEVITDIAQAEQTLTLVEATGARIVRLSLLNYL
jgi:flagellar hook-associated protein 3 FlgL